MLCKICNEGELVEDGSGAEVNLVCVECGSVDKSSNLIDSQIVSDPSQSSYAPDLAGLEAKYKFNTGDSKLKYSKRCVKFHEDIQLACSQLTQNHKVISKTAYSIFDSFAKKLSFGKHERFKKQLAASCLYVALMQHDVSITVNCVVEAMQVSKFGLSKVINLLKKEMVIQPLCIQNVMESTVSTLETLRNRPTVVSKSLKILDLFEKMKLTEGRRRYVLAHAAAYLATISTDKKSHCLKPQQFCRLNNIGALRRDLLVSFQQRLYILIKRLPWIDAGQLNIACYHYYIDDLIKYANLLFSLEPQEAPEGHQPKGKKAASRDVICKLEKDLKRNEMTESEYLDVPLLFTKRRRAEEPKYEQDPPKVFPLASTKETLDENDIPDSEMKEYLREPEEVEKVMRISKMMQESE